MASNLKVSDAHRFHQATYTLPCLISIFDTMSILSGNQYNLRT